MLFKKISYLLVFFCIYNQCIGQQQGYTFIPAEYELEHLKLNNKDDLGLFSDIIEDKQGYIWITGSSGLYAFDGSNTIVYNNNKQYLLINDSITLPLSSVAINPSRMFWILEYGERMLLFNPIKRKVEEQFSKKTVNNEPIDFYPSCLNNSLYFSTKNIEQNTFSIWQKQTNRNPVLIYKAFNSADILIYKIVGNNHWIFEKNRLVKISLDGKTVEIYDLASPFLKASFPEANNEIFYFIDAKQNAIYTYNKQENKIEIFLTLSDKLKGKGPHFFVDSNTVYFGNNLSIFIIEKKNKTIQDLSSAFIQLAKKEAPTNLGVEFIKFYRLRDGTILAGTQKDIYRLKKKVPVAQQFLQKLNPENSISPVVSCRAIAEDDKKNIYISYYTGIAKAAANTNVYRTLDLQKYIVGSPLATYSLNYWKNHLLWNNLIIDLSNNKTSYMSGEKYGGHVTQYLNKDTVWLLEWGTNELNFYDLVNKRKGGYPIDKSLDPEHRYDAEMNDMTGDANGENLWIGTTHSGILLLTKKGQLIKQYTKKELSISDNKITDLLLMGDNLWFGCADGLGVLHIPSEKFTIYKNPVTVNSGAITNRIIFSIFPQDSQNFYLGSSHGLLKFNVSERKFYNLANDHPLANVEFNRASAFKASNGRYYFGSTDGLFSFTTDELQFFKASNSTPLIKLYGISVFNNHKGDYDYTSAGLDSLTKWVLQPYHNSIEFSFSVPEFYKKIYYSYRIIGQNNNWTDYKPENKILLYGLPPGKYTLEVKAATSLSDENASYYTLPIEMKQVWYKKGWVIALFFIGFFITIVGILRNRFNLKLQRQKDLANLRTKISSDLHDDVGTILSGLAMQSQVLTYSAKPEQKEPLLEISNMSRDAMERMRDTVWAMDSRKDKFENLIDRMRDFAEKNLALKNMTHHFEMINIDSKQFIDPEKRQAIYLIFKEAITNIIKHSNGNNVSIQFSFEKNKIVLTIKDNGSRQPATNSDGLGMSNMKMRAEKIGGTLSTRYDNGFTVELVI